jgi:hypothetical protein
MAGGAVTKCAIMAVMQAKYALAYILKKRVWKYFKKNLMFNLK